MPSSPTPSKTASAALQKYIGPAGPRQSGPLARPPTGSRHARGPARPQRMQLSRCLNAHGHG
eukprot:5744774-Pyramimonas_sp.AAC.1